MEYGYLLMGMIIKWNNNNNNINFITVISHNNY